MSGALPHQPEEFLDHVRSVPQDHVPTVEEELDEYLMLREVSGEFPSADEEEARAFIVKKRQRGLLLSFIAMVFVSLANKVFQKLETIPMYNYPNFLNLFTTFMYIPFSFAYILPMMWFGNNITPEQTRVPKKVFAIMGALDGLSGIMQVFASTYLGGSLIILLTQAAIPISMVISKRLMGTHYAMTQYIGATVVAMGIVVAIGPSLAVGSGKGSEAQELIWSFVLVLSCVPMALSSVYKELALGESELDPIYLNGWVAVFQLIISVPLALPAALAGDPIVLPGELPENLWDGWRCFLGFNSVAYGDHPDNCWPGGPLYVSLYLVANINFNILIIMILKYGSANILFLAMTICVPLGNLTFALPFVPGHAPLQLTDILGLIFVLSGLVVYRFGSQVALFFGDMGLNSKMATKAAGLLKGRGGGGGGGSGGGTARGRDSPSVALGEHRRPLLDLAEEGDEFIPEDVGVDGSVNDKLPKGRGKDEGDGQKVGGARAKGKKPTKQVVDTEWEM